jgi:hypothetical protein
MLLGNAHLEAIYGETQDRYGRVVSGAILWHGRVQCRVVDVTRTLVAPGGGRADTFHQTRIWIPAGMVADDGSKVALKIDDSMDVRQDGVVTRYVVTDWSDWGQRLLGSPSDIRVDVERRGA